MVKLRRVYESYLYLESKKDLDDLKSFLGDKLFDDYMKIRDRIPKDQNEFKDFSKLKKMDKKDIQDFIDNFKSKSDKKKSDKTEGAEKLYEDSDWVVYKITSYPAAQLYGKNTKWCITGRYDGHESRGEEYFNDYIEDKNLDGGYYFYISKKDPNEKYCILQTKDKRIHSIWDAKDDDKGSSAKYFFKRTNVVLPEVKEVNLDTVSDTYKNSVALYKALGEEDLDLIKSLLENGVDLEEDPYDYQPFIFRAIGTDNKDIVGLLLKYGADPNSLSSSKFTPVQSAVQQGNVDILELLLKNGASLDIKSKYSPKPLLFSSLRGKKDIVDVLLKYGADPNEKDEYGYTPLYNSIDRMDKNKVSITKSLLEHGADPNLKGYNDTTPLVLSTMKGNKDIVELLLEHGADPNVSSKGYTPIEVAKEWKYKEIEDLLRKYGAKE